MTKVIDFFFIFSLFAMGVLVYSESNNFIYLTTTYPIISSFIKFSILATMGELLAKRIVDNKWKFIGSHLFERAFVWGFLGIVISYIFDIYSSGIDFLISKNKLFVISGYEKVSSAFWASFWMNMIFGFPMMIFHRVTDMLIDRRSFLKRWPFMKVWQDIDWKNMWGIVAPTIVWFWIPVQTIVFCLPAHFRIIVAAGLSMCLGVILSFARKKAVS